MIIQANLSDWRVGWGVKVFPGFQQGTCGREGKEGGSESALKVSSYWGETEEEEMDQRARGPVPFRVGMVRYTPLIIRVRKCITEETGRLLNPAWEL